jgi:hypothetical protein
MAQAFRMPKAFVGKRSGLGLSPSPSMGGSPLIADNSRQGRKKLLNFAAANRAQ